MKVLPKKKVLNGTGYVWEYLLAQRGWNELPDEQKFGIVLDDEPDEPSYMPMIRWPSCGNLVTIVFRDEIEYLKAGLS